MKIKDGYLLRNIADEWLVVPIGKTTLDFNGIIRVSETGAFFWKMLETGSERDLLIEALLNEYDVSLETAEKDLNVFLKSLADNSILCE